MKNLWKSSSLFKSVVIAVAALVLVVPVVVQGSINQANAVQNDQNCQESCIDINSFFANFLSSTDNSSSNDENAHLFMFGDDHGKAEYRAQYPTQPLQGQKITLIPKPNAGYELLYWEVYNDKGDVTINYEDNTFIMPNHDVEIQAHFVESSWIEIKTAQDLLSIDKPGSYYLSSTIGPEGLVLDKTWNIPHKWELFSSETDETSLDLNGKTISLADTASASSPVICVTNNILYSSSTVLNLLDSSANGTGTITHGHASGIKVDGGVLNMGGGNITHNNNANAGGGVYVVNGGTFNLKFGKVEYNNAKFGGGIAVTSGSILEVGDGVETYVDPNDYPSISFNTAQSDDGTGSYGAVYVNQSSASFYYSIIQGNNAELRGGALGSGNPVSTLLPTPSEIDVYSGTEIFENSAAYGGAIYNKSILNLEGAEIHTNSAEYGGAICNEIIGVGTIATFDKGTKIHENYADYGGALYNVETLKIATLKIGAELRDVKIYDNCADCFGGAIVNTSSLYFDGENVEICNNTATDFGAGLVSGRFSDEKSIITFADDEAACYIEVFPNLHDNLTDAGLHSDLVTSPECPISLSLWFSNPENDVEGPIYFNIYDKNGVERCGRLTSGYHDRFDASKDLDDVFVYQQIEGHEGFQSWGDADFAYDTQLIEEMLEIWVDHEHEWSYAKNEYIDEAYGRFYKEVIATCDVETQPVCVHSDAEHAYRTTLFNVYGNNAQFNNSPQDSTIILTDELAKATEGDAYLDYANVKYKGIGTTIYEESNEAPKLIGKYEVTYPVVVKAKSGNSEIINLVFEYEIVPQTVIVNFECADKVYDTTTDLFDSSFTYSFMYTDGEVEGAVFNITGAYPLNYLFPNATAGNCVVMDVSNASVSVTAVPEDWAGTDEEFLQCFKFDYNELSIKGTITPLDIENCIFNVLESEFVYDGNWHSPKYELKVAKPDGSSATLIKGIDYTDAGNIPLISPGKYTWNIVGLGNIIGEKDIVWSITKA